MSENKGKVAEEIDENLKGQFVKISEPVLDSRETSTLDTLDGNNIVLLFSFS
ncbi:15917_t:CDS:2 [Funneliformis mosseae]|uniref:15917_t:CDS:1 n=1 Tax=Funneliformis mosseae TaxID=27381 RepID=A0A9N8Z242_FUNMO|nr:15917_t:CDS:2 [Funneliformis mosseae]